MTTQSASPFSLAGHIAVVTGGGTGLGLGIARCYVQAGARVVIVGRREQVLQSAARELGHETQYRIHDVTHFDQNSELIDEIEKAVGPIDILVNNAGNHLKKPALETTETEYQSLLDTHLTAAFSLTRATARRMLPRECGSILFIASMTSYLGMPLVTAYSTAKTGCLGLVRSLAAELSPGGIRVNAIAPGWIETPMTERAFSNDPARKARVLARTPMARLGQSDDIGHAAVFLSSSAARFITGATLNVDGGASIGF
jgi:gluconate 5-dehydrogenase